MQTIKIYGASDDLVEIEGRIEGCDEYGFYRSSEDPERRYGYIAVSDGSVIRIGYAVDGTGCWRIAQVHGGRSEFKVIQTGDEDAEKEAGGYTPYSDVVELTGDIAWVKFLGNDAIKAYSAAGVPF